MHRKVLTWPDERLLVVAREVPVIDAEVRALVADMFETMQVEGGVGLAATQLGISLRVVVMDCSKRDERARPRAFINPRIVGRDGTVLWREGCLSVPGITAEVERAQRVVVEYRDIEGTLRAVELADLEAVCAQHEIDHLDGYLYVDRLGALERKAALLDYDEARRRGERVL